MKYQVHQVDINMAKDRSALEQFLNGLHGEVVAIVPNVTAYFLWFHRVDFLFVVEKVED
jgi:hypothetical protein